MRSFIVNNICGVALGNSNEVSGIASAAIGSKLKVSSHEQTVVGRFNIEDIDDKYAFIVGNGNIKGTSLILVSAFGHHMDDAYIAIRSSFLCNANSARPPAEYGLKLTLAIIA